MYSRVSQKFTIMNETQWKLWILDKVHYSQYCSYTHTSITIHCKTKINEVHKLSFFRPQCTTYRMLYDLLLYTYIIRELQHHFLVNSPVIFVLEGHIFFIISYSLLLLSCSYNLPIANNSPEVFYLIYHFCLIRRCELIPCSQTA